MFITLVIKCLRYRLSKISWIPRKSLCVKCRKRPCSGKKTDMNRTFKKRLFNWKQISPKIKVTKSPKKLSYSKFVTIEHLISAHQTKPK